MGRFIENTENDSRLTYSSLKGIRKTANCRDCILFIGNMKTVVKSDIADALENAGLQKGDSVMVHSSLGKIGYVCGGAQAVIEALIESVGEEGTIMMPAQSWKNLDPETGVHWDADEADWDKIRENWPAYNKEITPANTMGAVAEMFRSWPGAVRSDHPARSVAAWGKNAEYLTKDHNISDIFGDTSPIGKLYELDGKVLLIGVDYDKNTSIHLADVRAEYRDKHTCVEHSAVMENGMRIWKAYETLFVDGKDFIEIGTAFEALHHVNIAQIGETQLKIMKQRELVDFAVEWIEKNRK